MPGVSIIVPTNSIGGLDVTLNSLQLQTAEGYEVIIIDTLHEFRSFEVSRRASSYKFPILHIRPLNPVIGTFGHLVNTGLVYANYDTIVIAADHTWFSSNFVKIHQDFYLGVHLDPLSLNHSVGLICPYQYSFVSNMTKRIKSISAPMLYKGLPNSDDLRMMWSCFDKEPLCISDIYNGLSEDDLRSKGQLDPHVHVGSLRNGSTHLNNLLKVNGLVESIDDSQCLDIFIRLLRTIGVKWFFTEEQTAFVVSFRHPPLPKIDEDMILEPRTDRSNNWSIRDRRLSLRKS